MAGHGWVTPLPGGAKARCGGPPLCLVCVMEGEGVKITPAVEQLAHQRSQLMSDMQAANRKLAELTKIAAEFRPGQFRTVEGGKAIACVHCDEERPVHAGFYRDHHADDCPVRLLINWFNRNVETD